MSPVFQSYQLCFTHLQVHICHLPLGRCCPAVLSREVKQGLMPCWVIPGGSYCSSSCCRMVQHQLAWAVEMLKIQNLHAPPRMGQVPYPLPHPASPGQPASEKHVGLSSSLHREALEQSLKDSRRGMTRTRVGLRGTLGGTWRDPGRPPHMPAI